MLRRETIVITPSARSLLGGHGLDSVKKVYGCTSGPVVTRSGTTEVRRVPLGAGQDAAVVFIKKYWSTHASQLWSGMLRGTFFGRSKVRREFENLSRLRAWGFDAPEPLAYGEERRAGWLVRSFLISRSVPNPVPLHVFIRERLGKPGGGEARALREKLIEKLAGYTRRLHERRFVHHDYFWRNILLSGGSLEHYHLIDAHKGRCWRPWEEDGPRAKDLAALDAPAPHFFRRTERLRFFLLYRGRRRLEPKDKALLRRTLRLADPLRERQLRRAIKGWG